MTLSGPSGPTREPEVSPGRREEGPRGVGRAVLLGTTASLVVIVASLLYIVLRQDHSPTLRRPTASDIVALDPPTQVPLVGSFVSTRINPHGEVHVDHWIRTSTPLASVTLPTPPSRGDTPGAVASNVLVRTQHESVEGVTSPEGQRFEFRTPARLVLVAYSLDGAVHRSPTVKTRALVDPVAVEVQSAPRPGPVRYRIVSQRTLSVTCSRGAAEQEQARPCGQVVDQSWQVLLRGPARGDRLAARVAVRP